MGGSGQVKVTTIYFDFDRHLPTVEDDSSSSDDFGRSVNHQPSTVRYVNINQSLKFMRNSTSPASISSRFFCVKYKLMLCLYSYILMTELRVHKKKN